MQIYSKEEKTKHLKQWRSSGLSGQEYCRRNNIRPTTLYSWTKKERQDKAKKNIQSFVKVSPVNIRQENSDQKIVVEYQGIRIQIPVSAGADYLIEILQSIGLNHVS